ncbi:hypothetical protein Tsubulata_038303 [Turnera subulata]|uniref:Pentatricopeptide repeat-containing protein-mitochondrial domain-containing protein n=1 Tax=Turnera subulata TaxID=218843 RepID=A0A9Q0JQI0_9ROSI|nr:hypothetical protein Tsubulata_038303 [Turnera subulata]
MHIPSCCADRTCRSTWFPYTKMKIPEIISVSGLTKLKNSFSVLHAVDGTDSSLVSQEREEKELVGDGEDFSGVVPEGYSLPPWGNVMAQQESYSAIESSIETSTIPQNDMVSLDETRVHFLEETDEGELSRRILVLSRSNRTRSAMELFRSMEYSGLRPNAHACNSLISCLVRCKQLDNAMRVFEFMKTNEIASGHTFSLILKAVADIQGCDSALGMFAELGGFARGKNDFDAIVYNTMLSVCARANKWVETTRIWRSMKENGHRGTEITYSLLVSIFVRCGQNKLAVDAYREMVQDGLKARQDTMQTTIEACSKHGKWDMALDIFQNMLNQGWKPNLIACNALLNALGKAREVKLAFQVFKTVKSIGYAPDSYTWNALLGGLYRANKHAEALQLFESLNREHNSQLNERLYNSALMSCRKLGLWDNALQVLWQFEASGQPVPTASYNLVIGACKVARKPEVALQVYEHMVHQKCTPDSSTYLSLIRVCTSASLWAEAEKILDVAPKASLYNIVIHGMCFRGKVESAKKLYLKMRRAGLYPDGKSRALMLQHFQSDLCETSMPDSL